MKHIILVMLIFVMAILDLKILRVSETFGLKETFSSQFDYLHNIDFSKFKNINDIVVTEYFKEKPVIWIYNEMETSARHWLHFHSRRSVQPTPALNELCINSVAQNNRDDFNIVVFNQNDISNIIPEYAEFCKKITNKYTYCNFIKYCILYKYGGYWVPNDVITLKKLSKEPFWSLNILKVHTFHKMPFTNYTDEIIACQRGNPVIRSCIEYILDNLKTFQNEIAFSKSIQKHFSSLLHSGNHLHMAVSAETDNLGNHVNATDLMAATDESVIISDETVFIPLHLCTIKLKPKYNYIFRMSEQQILESDTFIAKVFNRMNNKA
jgi:hypothetical protein